VHDTCTVHFVFLNLIFLTTGNVCKSCSFSLYISSVSCYFLLIRAKYPQPSLYMYFISFHQQLNLLAGSFLGCWCNLPWVFKFKCPLFIVSIKQEEQCKHNGGFFQDVMRTWCKDEMQLLFTILVTFMIFFRFLNFYLCGKLENMVLHTGPSHS